MLDAVTVHERHAHELYAALVALLLNEVLGAHADAALVDCERRELNLPQRPRIELAPRLKQLLAVFELEWHRIHRQPLLPHHGFERLREIVNVHGASLLRGS